MTPGFVLLAHDNLGHVADVARLLAGQGCPVAIHVDLRVPRAAFQACVAACAGEHGIHFVRRRNCEWGTFGLVAATQAAASHLLDRTDVSHVCLLSGACLPIRPLADLRRFLADHPDTDFIESVDMRFGGWVQGGLSEERLTLRFPVSWRRHRWLFDRLVDVQRRLRMRRRLPEGILPHVGSQWWCLTRQTLGAILGDPRRMAYDRFFRWSWIPDETYFQTLARLHARRIESRSLTFARFDHQGKPHVFYDDHTGLLTQTDAFFARKIWPGAVGLYTTFLDPARQDPRPALFSSRPVERPFAESRRLRGEGRAGVLSMGRFPSRWQEPQRATPRDYVVFDGFDALVPGWHRALAGQGRTCHGRLFAPDRVEFDGADAHAPGCIPANRLIRDRAPDQFLARLLFHAPEGAFSLQFCPGDLPAMHRFFLRDRNVRILRLAGSALLVQYAACQGDWRRARPTADLPEVKAGHAMSESWSLAEAIAEPETMLAQVLARAFGDTAPPLAIPVPTVTGLAEFAAALGHPDAAILREAERERLRRDTLASGSRLTVV